MNSCGVKLEKIEENVQEVAMRLHTIYLLIGLLIIGYPVLPRPHQQFIRQLFKVPWGIKENKNWF